MPDDGQLRSALPPATARVVAFLTIVVSGVCGGLIGWKVTALQVDEGSNLPGLGGLFGAVMAAGGVAILAVLVLRAMTEWESIQQSGDPAAARRRKS